MNKNGAPRQQPKNGLWRRNDNSSQSVRRNSPQKSAGASNGTAPLPSSSSSNGLAKPHGGTPSDDMSKHMHDRFTYLLAKSVGCDAIVTVASGARFKGIFSAALTEGELGVVLREAKKYSAAPGEEDSKEDAVMYEQLVITPKDLVEICIEGPDLTPDKRSPSAVSIAVNAGAAAGPLQGFKTDTDISGRSQLVERELQRWTPDESEALVSTTLEDSVDHSAVSHWDQFAVNRQKFGVESTYDEHYYTTRIDKSHPEYKQREKIAEKIAAEIEQSGHGGNVHIAEERGIAIDDSGLDEEDKYSGVSRKSAADLAPQRKQSPSLLSSRQHSPGGVSQPQAAKIPVKVPHPAASPSPSGKYSPPAFRSPTGIKNNAGVPYDPAIISSSMAVPSDNNANVVPPPQPLVTPPPRKPVQRVVEPHKHPDLPSKSNGIESELAGNFRQFVSVEVERLNQKKQYLQKKEKSERLHDFKKFSEDYKIITPVPPDLLPILGKGKARTAASASASASSSPVTTSATSTVAKEPSSAVRKEQSAAPVGPVRTPTAPAAASSKSTTSSSAPSTTAGTPAAKPSASANETPAASAAKASLSPVKSDSQPSASDKPSASPSPAPADKDRKPKFNFNAPGFVFKPNPSASSFTPSFPSSSSSPIPAKQQVSRTPTPSTFFGPNKSISHHTTWKGKFNPFSRAKAEHTGTEPFHIERAFVTPPTWNATVERSYVDFFPFLDVMQPYTGPPRPRNGAVTAGGFPGSPGMAPNFVPVMPAFDERGAPVVPTNSPPPIPGMIPAIGYPQYSPIYSPQYYSGRPLPQQFIASPQMGFGIGYLPQQGYVSPRGNQVSMVSSGANSGFYYPSGPPPPPQQPMRGARSPHYSRHNSVSSHEPEEEKKQ